MKKLFLLTFALTLLCTWSVMGANNAADITIKDRLHISDKAAGTVQPVQEKAAVEKEMEQPRNTSISAMGSEIVIEKAPYTGPKNVPDQNIILQGGDDCASATAIGALPFSADGTTAGYADNYDEVCPYDGSTSPDVVYSYSPAADINVDISLCTGLTDYDTKVYVYANDCISGSAIFCSDDACTAPLYGLPYNSLLECVPLTAGNTYYIVVDGYGGDFGPYTLLVEECEPATGACCVDAECVATNTELECSAMGGVWFEGETCPEYQCPSANLCDAVPGVVWDNGDTDGANGLSMLSGVGTYRSILDDFVFATDVLVSDFHQVLLWNSGGGPLASDYDLIVWDDVGGAPGAPIMTLATALVSETPTGRTWFGRPEFWLEVAVAPTVIPAGTYWLEMHVVGPENAFAMAHANDGIGAEIIGAPVWVNYEDFGGLQPGIIVFGVDYGLNFCLTEGGEVIGACCNEDTGDCTDNVNVFDCPTGYRFEANTLCSELDPPCGEVPPCADFTVNAPGSWSGNTCGAGNECSLNPNSEEVIYEVIIPYAGVWAFETCGSGYDTYIYLGTTCCGQELGFNDDSGSLGPCQFTLQSYLEVGIAAGTYYLSLEGFSSNCGPYVLNVYEVVQPTGACCVGGDCVATNTQLECAAMGGLWFEGQTCPEYQCPLPGCIAQPPNAVNGYFADYDWPQWIADNFYLGAATDVYGFEFWGGYFSSDTPMDVDDFTIYIRADAGGLPGAALYEFHNIPATFREQTGEILFGVHEWRYEVCLGALNFGPGTFWVEIANNTLGNPDVWFWETGDLDPINGIPDGAWTPTSDSGPWNVNPGELAYTLLCSPCETPVGACCDDYNSDCVDNVNYEDCPTEFRFVPNTLCAELDPPCEPVLGACCVDTECVGDLTDIDCAAAGGTWYEGQTCASFDCAANALCIDRTNVVYNNGDTDGSNGLSMLSGAGTYRSILDDITFTETTTINDFHSTLLWTSGGGPFATGYDLILWDDAGGAPGAPIYTFDATLNSEAATGRVWFSRPEFMMSVSFSDVTLDPGTYWLEMHVVGPENAFAMAMSNDGIGDEIIGSQCWVNYEDFGGLLPGSDVFGTEYGLNFCLTFTGGGGEFPCGHYVLGDYNGSEVFNIADVIAAFSKLQTGSPDAANLCECPPGGGIIFAIAMDVNGNCAFNLADVIVAFSKLQTGSPELDGCDLCPPAPPPSPGGGDRPLIVPNLESKVKLQNQSGAQ